MFQHSNPCWVTDRSKDNLVKDALEDDHGNLETLCVLDLGQAGSAWIAGDGSHKATHDTKVC